MTAGNAEAVITFTGTPGATYNVTGSHFAYAFLNYGEYYDEPEPEYKPWYDQGVYNMWGDDPFYFLLFSENIHDFQNYFLLEGQGPDQPLRQRRLRTANTHAEAITYYTPQQLSQLINSAWSLFAPNCDSVFGKVIPAYTNYNFFESLLTTQIIQYPPGAQLPDDVDQFNPPDADTLQNQSGRPIRVFPNFYPTSHGFEMTNFQQYVLIHEGVHHYTEWYDFQSQYGPDFITKFGPYGYKNTSGTTNDFTVWISNGCPAS